MMSFALAALLVAAPDGAPRAEHARMTITESVMVRVLGRHRRIAPGPARPPQGFREKKGPHCIETAAIAGAAITSPAAVDMILKGGQRVRARLADECPALDYYSGFYVSPPADGKVCAGRDSIHTRSGGDCQIDKFRTLVPLPIP